MTDATPYLESQGEPARSEPFGRPEGLTAYPIALPVLDATEQAARATTIRAMLAGFELGTVAIDPLGYARVELGSAPSDRDPWPMDARELPQDATGPWLDYLRSLSGRPSVYPGWPRFLFGLRSVVGTPSARWHAVDRIYFQSGWASARRHVACGLGDGDPPVCAVAEDSGIRGRSLQLGLDAAGLAERLVARAAGIRRAAAGRTYELVRRRQTFRKVSDFSGCERWPDRPCDLIASPKLEADGPPWMVIEKRKTAPSDFQLGWALEVECEPGRPVRVRVVARATLGHHAQWEQWSDADTMVRESYAARTAPVVVIDAVDGTERRPDAPLVPIQLSTLAAYGASALGCAAKLH